MISHYQTYMYHCVLYFQMDRIGATFSPLVVPVAKEGIFGQSLRRGTPVFTFQPLN